MERALALDDELLLNQLEELAARLEITVRYEDLNSEDSAGAGGLCRMKGKYVLIIHSQTAVKEKVRIITEALKQFSINDLYVKPIIRKLLEGTQD
jgi:hypothetical protein